MTDDQTEAAYAQADCSCRGPHWSASAKPTRQQIDEALVDACLAQMVPPSELQRRHECGDHAACPPYWCDHVTPTPKETPDA